MIALSRRQFRLKGPFSGVQYVVNSSQNFFDSRTGELWKYDAAGKLSEKWGLTQLGQPMVKE